MHSCDDSVDRGNHFRRERRRGVDDHELVAGAQGLEHRLQERDRDGGRLVGTHRRQQDARSGLVLDEEVGDLVGVDRSAGNGEVVDRAMRPQAERQADVAELQVDVDDHRRPAALGERHREVARRERLPGAALGPENRDQLTGRRRGRRTAPPGDRLLEGERELCGRLRQRDQVVRADLEHALHEAVWAPGVDHDDRRPPRKVPRCGLDEIENPRRALLDAEDQEIDVRRSVTKRRPLLRPLGETRPLHARARRQSLLDRGAVDAVIEDEQNLERE